MTIANAVSMSATTCSRGDWWTFAVVGIILCSFASPHMGGASAFVFPSSLLASSLMTTSSSRKSGLLLATPSTRRGRGRRDNRSDYYEGGRRRRRPGDNGDDGWTRPSDDYDFYDDDGGERHWEDYGPDHNKAHDRAWDGVYASAGSPALVDEQTNVQRKIDAINCEHFGTCPGCVVNDHVTNIDIIKSAKLYFSSTAIRKHRLDGGTSDDDDFYKVVIPSSLTEWRTQAKLAVSAKSSWGRDGCHFGLYERKSHNVLPIPDCQVHHPSINRAIDALTEATATVQTDAYDESTGDGSLRYVQCQVERSTGKICLTLIMNAEQLKNTQPGLSRLVKQIKKLEPNLWHSIWCHCNDSAGNAIFSRAPGRWHMLDGPEFVREAIPGSDPEKREGLLYYSPTAFRQGNMDGFDVIARHVAQVVPPGSKVCELYAGIGVLGLTALLHHGRNKWSGGSDDDNGFGDDDGFGDEPLRWLRCSDENPANPRCFSRTVNSMPSEITGRPPRSMGKGRDKKGRRRRKQGGGKMPRGAVEGGNADGEMTMKQLMDSMMSKDLTGYDGGDDEQDKVKYMVASAAKALHAGQALGADVLIVDPPRKGLEDEVLEQLCKPHNPNQDYVEEPTFLRGPRHAINWVNDVKILVYVSCGFDALARDCDRLLSGNAGWKLESVTGYILFPGSNHVETLAIFQRRGRRAE